MSNAPIEYTDGEIGEVEAMVDFLPPPEELVLRPETAEVTVTLSYPSYQFYKDRAQALGVPCGHMIRSLLDAYVARNLRV